MDYKLWGVRGIFFIDISNPVIPKVHDNLKCILSNFGITEILVLICYWIHIAKTNNFGLYIFKIIIINSLSTDTKYILMWQVYV